MLHTVAPIWLVHNDWDFNHPRFFQANKFKQEKNNNKGSGAEKIRKIPQTLKPPKTIMIGTENQLMSSSCAASLSAA